jgi:flagellar hook-associated protein 2
MVSPASPASSFFTTLSSIGVQLQKDGSLKLDDVAFGKAVANLPELTKALSNVDNAVPTNHGFGKRFFAWTERLLASTGSLPGKSKSIQARIAANQKDQEKLSDRLEMVERRMRAQYSALDTTMAKANALSKYVQQQFYTKSVYDQDKD